MMYITAISLFCLLSVCQAVPLAALRKKRAFPNFPSFPSFPSFPQFPSFPSFPTPSEPMTCKVERVADGKVLQTTSCPGDVACDQPTGGVNLTISGEAFKVYFCDLPYPSIKEACDVKDKNGNVKMTKTCPTGKQCIGGPQNTTDFFGNLLTYSVCVVDENESLSPDYMQILLDRICCGGSSYSYASSGGSASSSGYSYSSSSGSSSSSSHSSHSSSSSSGKK